MRNSLTRYHQHRQRDKRAMELPCQRIVTWKRRKRKNNEEKQVLNTKVRAMVAASGS
ncbi:hypothetical protein AGR9A_Cc190008 [Agrobacterium salinitolerans str. Hayward 0363]|nr:hypothetical protein AGR9A_Cc190008 [Agrobacterium salinitolerans str. Hayward 0363]